MDLNNLVNAAPVMFTNHPTCIFHPANSNVVNCSCMTIVGFGTARTAPRKLKPATLPTISGLWLYVVT